ncbi:MAG: ferritin family protein [Candidatus Hydrogenedentota bacterium]|nr:MAG: ferritin family protein [Candidatus Hydrogenedentota bacterium]
MTELPENMQDIVKFALQLEEDGLRMYREFAEKSKDTFGKKTFEGLAEDEIEHTELLRKVYAKCGIEEVEQIVAESKDEPVRQRFKTIFQVAGEEARKRIEADPSDIEAMRTAMDFEKRGYRLYKEAEQKAKGEMERNAFKHLSLMEKHHYELLQETYEYLNDTGNWFMKNEGWMFEAG